MTNIPMPKKQLAEHYRKWRITELVLFGSVLRDDLPQLITQLESIAPPEEC
uniref:Uncharacterized protein n=1 Tax=Candidatus Kentrum sp. TUN TaxID=2126343 RepID=A0A450ZWB0_9GAMM|nr:MAG: hypothetical protein BECKTUN1418D_GA0071000_10757 [Candidatus Kentron sp. TUN]